jgi:membrane-bound lytic murein transglycosylase D
MASALNKQKQKIGMIPRFASMALVALLVGACAEVPLAPQESLPGTAVQSAPAKEPSPVVVQNTSLVLATEPPPAVAQNVSPAPAAAPLPEAAETAPPQPADMWERLRAGFRIPDMDNKRVRMWERYYSDRPDYVEFIVELGSHYLYYVVQEVERRNMPAEIALLPMIESAYNPYAYSRSHASGMWQFIRSTAKVYGLRQNYWYDGRRDVMAATNAALDYLQDLHAAFGSWDLALAAYNMGEGGLSRAIARNKARKRPTDYEHLRIPRETRNYFPKLQAVKNIISDPARFGLKLAAIPNQPYFTALATDRHIDVKLAAELAEISIEEFRILNPAHNKPVIRAANGTDTILLPLANVETFRRNLAAYEEPLVSWQVYKFKRKDRLAKIAAKHGVSLAYLKQVNGIAPRRWVKPGQSIVVPVKSAAEPNLPDLPAPRFIRVRYYPQPKKKLEQPDTRTSAPPQFTTRIAQKPAGPTHVALTFEGPLQEDGLVLARHALD